MFKRLSGFQAGVWVGLTASRLLGCLLGIGLLIGGVFCMPALAVDLVHQTATEVQVDLGNRANELKFVPNHLDFIAGQRYKLVLHNPSEQKHYFTAKDFADAIWSQKVEAGKVEVKGAIHELELKPGATAEWVFIPLKGGTYELHCSVPGHTEAGMTGDLAIAVE